MFTLIIRVTVIFVLLVLLMRLMGKRQLGEMQPFELVITLVISEVACIPMSDPAIPFTYGVVPILVIFLLHYLISLLSRKFIKFRRVVDGTNIIVINPDGVDYQALKQLNMNVNDLLEVTVAAGYYDLSKIYCAFFQTNGKLAVIPTSAAAQPTAIDFGMQLPQTTYAKPFIEDGKAINLEQLHMTQERVQKVLKDMGIDSVKNVMLATVDCDGNVYCKPRKGKFIAKKLPELAEAQGGAA